MRIFTFAKRNVREILRDPLNLCFGLGFPALSLRCKLRVVCGR